MNKRIASVALRLALLLASPFAVECGFKQTNGVAVNVPALPPGAVSIDALLKLDGRQVGNESFTQELTGIGPRLAFSLPLGTRGALEVELLAKNKDGCVIARSVQTVQLSDDKVQTIEASFGKLPQPVITSVSKKLLPNDQDSALTITGDYFYACTTVQVGGQSVSDLQIPSSTQMTMMVPMRKKTCGSVDIKVTGGDAQQMTTGKDLVTFFAPNPSYLAAAQISLPRYAKELIVDDINGDNMPDLLLQGTNLMQTPQFMIGAGNGTFSSAVNIPVAALSTEWKSLATGDVNGV